MIYKKGDIVKDTSTNQIGIVAWHFQESGIYIVDFFAGGARPVFEENLVKF